MPESSRTPPQAMGPYSTTRRVGDVLYLSGQSATDPATGAAMPGDIPAQTERTLRNMHALLESEGFVLADLVQVICYLTDMDDWPQMNTAYAAYFGDGPLPTRTAVGVASLPFGLNVEMTAIAHRGGAVAPSRP